MQGEGGFDARIGLERIARAILYPSGNRIAAYPQKENAAMNQTKFPPGWDEEKVRRVLAHYSEQTDEEALLEGEAGVEPSDTVMNVPHDLVSKVRELIAKRRG